LLASHLLNAVVREKVDLILEKLHVDAVEDLEIFTRDSQAHEYKLIKIWLSD